MARRIVTKSGPPAPALAKPGDPLVLFDGVIIEPDVLDEGDASKPAESVYINSTAFKAHLLRSIAELPDKPTTINALSAILMYTLLGLTDQEIGQVIGISRREVTQARSHSTYKELFDTAVNELINANSEVLASRLAAHASTALTTVTTLAVKAKKEETRLRASQDVLDRANVRPQDMLQRGQQKMNELRIVISKASDEHALSLELNGTTIEAE